VNALVLNEIESLDFLSDLNFVKFFYSEISLKRFSRLGVKQRLSLSKHGIIYNVRTSSGGTSQRLSDYGRLLLIIAERIL